MKSIAPESFGLPQMHWSMKRKLFYYSRGGTGADQELALNCINS
jgi:hypothetical protein